MRRRPRQWHRSRSYVALTAIATAAVLTTSATARSADVGRGTPHYRFDASERIAAASQFTPWADLQRRLAAEPDSLADCVADAARCPATYSGARRIVLRARELPFGDRLELVNRFVNRRTYVEPLADQRWETLKAFLRRGGDCEDYAVAKYLLLREIGVPAEDLRIAVADTRRRHGHHALLAVRTPDGTALLLDTDGKILHGERPSDYLYLYSVNEFDLFDHALAPAARARLLANEPPGSPSGGSDEQSPPP